MSEKNNSHNKLIFMQTRDLQSTHLISLYGIEPQTSKHPTSFNVLLFLVLLWSNPSWVRSWSQYKVQWRNDVTSLPQWEPRTISSTFSFTFYVSCALITPPRLPIVPIYHHCSVPCPDFHRLWPPSFILRSTHKRGGLERKWRQRAKSKSWLEVFLRAECVCGWTFWHCLL